MVPDPARTASDAPFGGPPDADEEVRVLLFMRPGRDRELVAEALGDRFRVDSTTDAAALDSTFDCCVFGAEAFERAAEGIESRRERAAPAFLPFVLLASGDTDRETTGSAWDHVDDVIELPVRKGALRTRIGNLVERRRTSLRLADRERRLAAAVEELRQKERAMDEAPVGITLAEPGTGNNPLTYVNGEFERLTGYGPEMLGKDCRFLQGEHTNPEKTAAVREAIDDERPISVDVLNYRANGQKFWNQLTVAPIHENGDVIRFVGFQTDITDRKIRERRLEVMGRVLNHNLRNKMNLIEGYTDLLRTNPDEEQLRKSLDVIAETTDDLMRIAEAVRKIDHTLSKTEPAEAAVELRDRLSELLSQMTDRYPDATFHLSLPDDDPLCVSVLGLQTAIEEGVENAVKHNDDPDPTVWIRVERGDEGWIEIEIEDDGPGIPEHETHVLERGETSLKHADRLGIWLMYWVVGKAGGEFSVALSETGGTILRIVVPAHP
ncbi:MULTISPECIES: PAS domain-containing protein [Halorubrum]|nr:MULTISPECIES: PAS domain-containing protein [Halorubrum]